MLKNLLFSGLRRIAKLTINFNHVIFVTHPTPGFNILFTDTLLEVIEV